MSIKKRIRPGRIEASSDGRAIVVHFTTEITHLDEQGQPTHVEKAPPDQKVVSIGRAMRGLEADEIPYLAEEIVERCKYIPATKLREVEQVLAKMHAAMPHAELGEHDVPRWPSMSPSPVSPSPVSLSPTRSREPSTLPAEEHGYERDDPRSDRENRNGRRRKHRERSAAGRAQSEEERRVGSGDGRHRRQRSEGGRGGSGRRKRRSRDDDDGRCSGDGPWSGVASQTPSLMLTGRLDEWLPEASVDRVDDYAEELYEERMEAKAQGARRLLRLCSEVRPLMQICGHSTLLGVLSRELRENAKRSHELAVAITGIFLCLAHFSQFHEVLIRHECNDVTMRVVEYESKRRNALKKELDLHRGRMVAKGSSATAEEHAKLELEEQRYQEVLERQDRLLQLCLLALRSLAEDYGVEQKLVKQRICLLLVPTLDRTSEDLLVTALGFLHKLVVFEENKDQFVQNIDALGRLAELVGHRCVEVAHMALRVCYNLSFDGPARNALATQTTLLSRLRPAVQHGPTRKVSLKLLYQLSTDVALRATIAHQHPECLALAMQLLARFPEHYERNGSADTEAAALSINLAADEVCSALFLENELFVRTALKAIRSGHPLLLKVVRHVVSHASLRPRLLAVLQEATRSGRPAEWLHELLQLAITSSHNSPEILVEVLGVFAALECVGPEVPWSALCDAGLLDLLHRLLIVGFSEDDVVLEAVMVTSNLALDPSSIPLLAVSKVPSVLPNLLTEKEQDADIVVQLLFTMRCLLLQDETREVLLHETDAPERILELLREIGHQSDPRSQAIQAAVEETLELILQVDGDDTGESSWAAQIKALRFELHNMEWCHDIMRTSGADDLLLPRQHDMPALQDFSDAKAAKIDAHRSAMRWTDVGGLADRRWETNSLRLTKNV